MFGNLLIFTKYEQELTTVAPTIKDESSSEIFGLIRKINTVSDKRKPKASCTCYPYIYKYLFIVILSKEWSKLVYYILIVSVITLPFIAVATLQHSLIQC